MSDLERLMNPEFPSLYEINTRVWLGELWRASGSPCTLAKVPDAALDQLAERGFDWVWLLGVWQTGPAGRQVSLTNAEWRREYQATLTDFKDEDVSGSPFAVQSYTVHDDFGGPDALEQLRDRLQQRGLRLMLDFVPNHTAPDHPWVYDHPDYYVRGQLTDLQREPRNWRRVQTCQGELILAYGRDPYFPGWPDTLQLNYRHAGMRQAMLGELQRIADQCDGIRCDMAMLPLPDVFQRTWGQAAQPGDGSAPVDTSFWLEVIPRVQEQHSQFLFMAEAYWDLEWTLQQQGFDYTYDKRLYDRLHARDVEGVRGHLRAAPDFMRKSVRFLENHDEPRAASAFPPQVHRVAALVCYLVPGLRFFHDGQLEGRKQRVSMHLGRRPDEPVDTVLQEFYGRLLTFLMRPELRDGRWQLLDIRPAWHENRTWNQFVAFAWEGRPRLLAVVNYQPNQGQCYVTLPWPELKGKKWCLRDQFSSARYDRDGDDLQRRGLYLDMPEWGHHVFQVIEASVPPEHLSGVQV
jgi:hypothetical protein